MGTTEQVANLIELTLSAIDPRVKVYNSVDPNNNFDYFVFTIDSHPEGYADGEPMTEVFSVAVHYISPHPNLSLYKMIDATKAALRDAHFKYPSVSNLTDGTVRHYVFETGCTIMIGEC